MTLESVLGKNRILFVLDAVAFAASIALTTSLRFDLGPIPETVAREIFSFALLAIPAKLLTLVVAGTYRRLWTSASVTDLLHLGLVGAGASGAGLLIGVALVAGAGEGQRPPISVIGFDALLTVMLPVLPRSALRIWEQFRSRPDQGAAPVLIAGAGSAGQMIAKELTRNAAMRLIPVGFVDDDPQKRGRLIVGFPVLGRLEDIPAIAARRRIEQILIAMPSAPGAVVREVLGSAARAGLQTRTLPSLPELLEGSARVTSVREVRIEDLLRRAPVQTDLAAVQELVGDRSVLVTGAGGSIGSELCRQIASCQPARLVLMGHGENSLFDIQQELLGRFPDVTITAVVADIRDRARVATVVEQHRPHVIFHAAAHKHVPLMEENVVEAITNNVLGTQHVVDAAIRGGVPRLVMISTDKAVRPTSIMGATKRVAEKVVQLAAVRHGRSYVAVRFGNVLGSRGSVVPTFMRQIRDGGPVTVTDPEMRRYFMTIPEAVQLVLQAGAMGVGAEVFLLDMGEPVRVVDLATDLIRLSGFEPGRDIKVVFTGRRPGEKLYEEMFFSDEEAVRTSHPKILRAKKAVLQDTVPRQITSLIEAALEGQPPDELRRRLEAIVPDFRTAGQSQTTTNPAAV
jgi:FlaA1/EpsC-like NDP-sugar epimerase